MSEEPSATRSTTIRYQYDSLQDDLDSPPFAKRARISSPAPAAKIFPASYSARQIPVPRTFKPHLISKLSVVPAPPGFDSLEDDLDSPPFLSRMNQELRTAGLSDQGSPGSSCNIEYLRLAFTGGFSTNFILQTCSSLPSIIAKVEKIRSPETAVDERDLDEILLQIGASGLRHSYPATFSAVGSTYKLRSFLPPMGMDYGTFDDNEGPPEGDIDLAALQAGSHGAEMEIDAFLDSFFVAGSSSASIVEGMEPFEGEDDELRPGWKALGTSDDFQQ